MQHRTSLVGALLGFALFTGGCAPALREEVVTAPPAVAGVPMQVWTHTMTTEKNTKAVYAKNYGDRPMRLSLFRLYNCVNLLQECTVSSPNVVVAPGELLLVIKLQPRIGTRPYSFQYDYQWSAAAPAAGQSRSMQPMPQASAPEFDLVDAPAAAPGSLASPIIVSLGAPVAAAFDRVVVAFAAEGLRVPRSDRAAGRVSSAGVPGEGTAAGGSAPTAEQAEYFYHATIAPAEQGSRVVFSVSMRTHMRSSSGTKTTPESEVQACRPAETPAATAAFQRCEQQMASVKARLDSLARRVQASSR
jgi:hypothetical protein